MMIVSAEKCLSNSDRATDMLKDIIAFSGIPGLFNHFQPPGSSSTRSFSFENDASVLESPEDKIQQISRPSKITECESSHIVVGIIS